MDKNKFKQAILGRKQHVQEEIEDWEQTYLVDEATKQDLLGNNTLELTEDSIPQDDFITMEVVKQYLIKEGFSVTEVYTSAISSLGKTLIVGWE